MKRILLALLLSVFCSPAWAADSTVSAMSAASTLDGTELYYCVQAGADRKCTGTQIKTLANTSAVNAQTGATYTVQASDQGKLVTFSNAGSIAVTQPQAGATFFSGWTVSFRNLGAGTVTVTPTTSTVDGAASFTLTTGQGVDMYSDGTNYFTQPGAPRLAALSGLGTNVATALGIAVSSPGGVTTTVTNGTVALGTAAISSGACASAVTAAATNLVTTDVLLAGFNADPTSTTGYSASANGMLTIIAYPTSGVANFKVCNNTASTVTPGAITLNWRVVR